MFNASNSKKQGDIGLGCAIGWFASKGYTVSIPLTDSQDYDLVVDIDRLSKVQVKTTSYKKPSGYFEVGLRTLGGNQSWNGVVKHFDPLKIDYLFVVTSEGECFLIPSSKINSKNSITLGLKYKEFSLGKILDLGFDPHA